MLQDGMYDSKPSRLCLSLVSRTMLSYYGCTLTSLRVRHCPANSIDSLVSLVNYQRNLERVCVHDPPAIIALVAILTQGCLRHVRELTVVISVHLDITVLAAFAAFAGVLHAPGTLQDLECLCIKDSYNAYLPDTLSLIVGALTSGALPALRVLDLDFQRKKWDHGILDALAAMLEARAAHGACQRLEQFEIRAYEIDGNDLSNDDLLIRCRLLRALLQSVTKLPDRFRWNPAYEACFVAVRPPRLKRFCIDDGTSTPSVEVLEAMSEMEELVYRGRKYYRRFDLGSVVSALNRGIAFQRLQSISFTKISMGSSECTLLLDALKEASCAQQLMCLALTECELCPAMTTHLSLLLGQDSFPMLQRLNLDWSLTDEGVTAILHGLNNALRTRLRHLTIRMGDDGMVVMADLIRSRRLECLESICLNGNRLTDQGVLVLARCINDYGKDGLLMLRTFSDKHMRSVTNMGVTALAFALIKNCPRLNSVDLSVRIYVGLGGWKYGSKREVGLREIVDGMVLAYGCRHRLTFDV